ncbi:MAG: hypothetical protein WBC59_09335, partial [Phycisphaerae bacterium]
MTEGYKIFWGAVGALVVAVIIAIIYGVSKLISTRRSERIVLSASLSITGDINIINAIGCAGLLLAVVCKSKRPAKIKDAYVSVKGRDLLAAFQKGFGSSFGLVPVPEAPPPRMLVYLVPISRPSVPEGFVLQRDDVCRFVLPIQVPGLPKFVTAKPEDVAVEVTFFDSSKQVLLRGKEVQEPIRGLIQTWGGAV